MSAQAGADGALDAAALGFMCGIEVHQQLATGKLHSRQPGDRWDLSAEELPPSWGRVRRRLRAAAGEGGEIDVAARFEAQRNRSFEYVQTPNAGLVELDEAPPQPLDGDALEATLIIAAMLEAAPVPALQTMRKTVVDGSNTSGFQRTTLVATGGTVHTDRGEVGVSVVCLEEDSARKLASTATDAGELVTYTLDRLGVPLIELATEPDVIDPEHAHDVAAAIGSLLRDTGRVRRGLGSIRQDLNISIACGDRVEIKGCQDLDRIPEYIRVEMARQLHLYELATRLRAAAGLPELSADRRDDHEADEAAVLDVARTRMSTPPVDLGSHVAGGPSALLQRAVRRGDAVLGMRLPGLAGLLGRKDPEAPQRPRLGAELTAAAGLAGVKGILHSDEMPGYGLEAADVDDLRAQLGAAPDDAIALCAAPAWQASLALKAVQDRAALAFCRSPREVRAAQDDGTTRAMRPLPGGARMYPETDVPLVALAPEVWQAARAAVPEPRSQRIERLVTEAGISSDLAGKLVERDHEAAFAAGIDGSLLGGRTLPATAWARWLDQQLAAVAEASGTEADAVPRTLLGGLLAAREDGHIATDEGAVDLAAALLASDEGWPADGPSPTPELIALLTRRITEAADDAGLSGAADDAIEAVVRELLAERADFIRERGQSAMGPLMGVALGRLGQADARVVSQVLHTELAARLADQ